MVRTSFRSSAGVLEAIHDAPEGPAPTGGPRGALVCHPHPLHGGTMDNKVVHTLARRFRERGLHVLRFNFRGAGGSEGEHDGGVGERDDVAAGLDHLEALAGHGPLLVAGFSFGSYVGLTVGLRDPRVTALMAVAPPVNVYDYGAISAGDKPLAVIYALADELVPADAVAAWLAGCVRPPRITPVVGAGHLFHGKLGPLRQAVDGFLDALQVTDGSGSPSA